MKRITTLMTVCVLGLLTLGLVMLYSVSPSDDSMKFVSRQAMAGAIGLTGAGFLAWVDYRALRRVSWPLLVGAVLLLLGVLLERKVNGARRWFRLPGFQFQPSDFAKLALLVALADYAAHRQLLMRTFRQGIVAPGILVFAVLGLIFLEPDWGTTLLLATVSGVVLLVAGVRKRHLAGVVIAGGCVLAVLLHFNSMRGGRIKSWLHPYETRDGVGYQGWHSKVALGLGGTAGVGLGNSVQKRLLPEHHTDFIFAIVAEEFGVAGSLTVVVTFMTLFLCGLAIASRAPDSFGQLLGTGISFLIGLQAFINIAVVSGALPNKGLALPFVSYGGSNLIVMLLCVGLLGSIARRATLEVGGEPGPVSVGNSPVIQTA